MFGLAAAMASRNQHMYAGCPAYYTHRKHISSGCIAAHKQWSATNSNDWDKNPHRLSAVYASCARVSNSEFLAVSKKPGR
jgi:hypothetical protein